MKLITLIRRLNGRRRGEGEKGKGKGKQRDREKGVGRKREDEGVGNIPRKEHKILEHTLHQLRKCNKS